MSKAYGYCRASTGMQDLTFDVQRANIERYFDANLSPKGFEWGGFYEDKAVSGAEPFTERPEGLKLWVVSQPGDAIIWMKMDRASRSTADGARLLEMLRAKRVAVHSLDLGLDMTSPTGQFMANLLISLGQLERSWISSRTKDAHAALRARGVPAINSIPCGYRRLGKKKKSELVPDADERLVMDRVHVEFMKGTSTESLSNKLYFEGVRRKTGAAYAPEWLAYGLVARALGYPAMFSYQEYRRILEAHKSEMTGRGRQAVLAKLALVQSGRWPGLSS